MKKGNHIRASAGILLVFFLFASILSITFSSLASRGQIQKVIVTKKSNSHSSSEIQLPYEEREKEEESESDDERAERLNQNLVFIHSIHKSFLLFIEFRTVIIYSAPLSCGSATNFPVYLFKRSLLI
jgi:hypothetical protein